ncbi:ABC transporter substrate-binding protein [Actinokineospora xionganensis]|uniref:ABC transporter substrate-binding protein n=1 Tax=Actinokineospora xionganensis TaxID=2684470 RepID=UPI001C9C63D5|nr:extracellular solute-binding protein [Actinokineospora xionganensis]
MFPDVSKRFAALAAAASVALGVTACAGSPEPDSAPLSSGPVTVEFWGWAPGYQEAADLFNSTHTDVKVKFNKTPSGSKGGYQQMLNAVKGGSAPCLAQVGLETLPTFVVEGALADVGTHAAGDGGKFVDWTWNQVQVGKAVFAAPVDTGPMVLYYRKDVFENFGVAVPTTWDEYEQAAKKIKAADPSYFITSFDSGDLYTFAGYAWQNGAEWFGTQGESWKVDVAGGDTAKVAEYWQRLLSEKLVKPEPGFDKEWNADVNSGKVASYVGASWASALIKDNAPDGKGKWGVAPMPQWTAGEKKAGNAGGSSTAVLKGCKDPKQAWDFAVWMSTDPAAYKILIEKAGLYPAAKSLLDLPELNAPSEYFAGQNLGAAFKEAANNTDTGWRWGPTMTQVSTDFGDAAGKAVTGTGTLPDALKAVQDKTVGAIKQKGLSVAGG